MCWSDLLKRVFATDVTRCPCGGRLRVLSAVQNPDRIQATLAAPSCRQQDTDQDTEMGEEGTLGLH